MAKIQTLKDNSGTKIYPNTRLDCIYTENGTLKDIIGNNKDISNIGDGSVTGILSALSDEYDNLQEEVNEGQKMISEALTERGISAKWESGFGVLANQIRDMILVKSEPVPVITQTVTVKPTAKNIRVVVNPDEGIAGISQVNASIDVEEKPATVLYGNSEIYSDNNSFLSKVTINGPIKHDAKEIILSTSKSNYIVPEGYHDGKGKVKIDAQEKSVNISTGTVNVSADDGKVLSKVTVHGPSNRGAFNATLNLNNKKAIINEGYHNGEGTVSINTQSKTITNNSGSTTVVPDNGYVLSSVTINGPSDQTGTLTSVAPKSIDDKEAVFAIPQNGYYDTTSKFSVSKSILKNNNLIVDNELHRDSLSLKTLSEVSGDFIGMTTIDDIPINSSHYSAVVLKDSIHLLGGTGTPHAHYKFDGKKWSNVDTIPVSFDYGSAVVLNDEIHILGGSYNPTLHYKWSNSQWIEVGNLPYRFYNGAAVVLNNEIHILGTSTDGYEKMHYKYTSNGNWVQVSTLPYEFSFGSAVIYKNQINILGSTADDNYTHNHYVWTGSEWRYVGATHYEFGDGLAVVLGDKLHIISGSGLYVKKWHCVWDGSNWYFDEFLPYYEVGRAAVAYYGDIHILGASDDSHPQARTIIHYESILGTLKSHGVNVYDDSQIYTLA